jgi:uncharacterized damage-inducible protein DinB
LKCFFGSPAKFTAKFHAERAAIRALVDRCPVERRGQRVLIPRLRGMEDSSRHWSVWMTLDHLRITNEAFAGVISQLSQNRTPPGAASTAAVKPSPDADAAVDAAYESSCDRVRAAAAAVTDWKTAARFAHPWFGPLSASAWYALAGMHLSIHRAQLAAILKRLE